MPRRQDDFSAIRFFAIDFLSVFGAIYLKFYPVDFYITFLVCHEDKLDLKINGELHNV
jgi:hypothetical protein